MNSSTTTVTPTPKGFKKCIGVYLNAEGKRMPKIFWLGHDETVAKSRATILSANWQLLKSRHGSNAVWTDREIKLMLDILHGAWLPDSPTKQIEQQIEVAKASFAAQPQNLRLVTSEGHAVRPTSHGAPAIEQPEAVATIHEALDAYADAVDQAPGAATYKKGIRDSVEAIKFYWKDGDMIAVDYSALETVTNVIKARPKSRMKTKATKKHEPISPYTVKRLLQHLRQALKWVHKQRHGTQRFGGWKMPEDGLELFGLDLDRIRTKQERDSAADGPDQITIEEIIDLYRIGIGENTPHKAWFLTALFCGQGQQELAVSRRDEFDLDTATFQHRRNKTGQKGVYWIPPELVTILREHFEKVDADADNLAFKTREGKALVTVGSDAVRQAYDDWRGRCRKAGKPIRDGITFYSLRRYFAHRAAMAGGDSLRDAALAHTAKSVGGKHYSNHRDYQAVAAVGKALHAELDAAGMFKAIEKKQPKAA